MHTSSTNSAVKLFVIKRSRGDYGVVGYINSGKLHHTSRYQYSIRLSARALHDNFPKKKGCNPCVTMDWRAKAKACKHRRIARAATHKDAAPRAAKTGKRGDIEILNELGRGSFGRVLKARIRRGGPDAELVALKVIEGATNSPSDANRR